MALFFRCIVLSLLTGAVCRASDVPPGFGTLQYLLSQASAVVRVDNASISRKVYRENSALLISDVQVADTLTARKDGGIRPGDRLTIVASIEANSRLGSDGSLEFSKAIIFVRGPVDPKEFDGLSKSRVVYRVVGGMSGIIPSSAVARQTAVSAYIKGSPMQRLAWAGEQIRSGDIDLQRSAIMECTRNLGDLSAIQLIAAALRSNSTALANKRFAVSSLRFSGLPEAIPALRELSSDLKAARSLRISAVEAIGSLPTGDSVLLEFEAGNDPLLRTKASELRAEHLKEGVDHKASSLPTSKPGEPESGIVKAEESLNAPDADEAAQLVAIRKLSRFESPEAVEVLFNFVLDDKRNEEIRRSALLGLAGIRKDVARERIRIISNTLPDGSLRLLSRELAQAKNE